MGKHQSNVQIKYFLSLKIFLPFFYLLILITFSILLTNCSSTIKYSSSESSETFSVSKNNIRVLLDEVHSFVFTVKNELIINNGSKNIASVKKNNKITIEKSGSKIELKIGSKTFTSEKFIFTAKENTVEYKNKNYRGELNFIVGNNKILIINNLDLDDYLKGVLPVEMGVLTNSDDYESLKAFAICARNFALMQISRKNKLYDVVPDVRDQVYGGKNVEFNIANKAVEETKGLALYYGNEIAQLFYHSTCGGKTEDANNVFSNAADYLVGISEGSYHHCEISPAYEWEERFSNERINTLLIDAGLTSSNEKVIDISIQSKFSSGRINLLEIKREKGNNIILKGNNIRYILKRNNGQILRSSLFEITKSGNEFIIKGKGNGHGAGLCQWGAISLSRKGRNYKQIISTYFPKLTIKKTYD